MSPKSITPETPLSSHKIFHSFKSLWIIDFLRLGRTGTTTSSNCWKKYFTNFLSRELSISFINFLLR